MRVAKHCSKLPRILLDSLSLGVHNLTGYNPKQPALAGPALNMELD